MKGKKNIDFSIIWKKIHGNNSGDEELNVWMNESDNKREFYKSARKFYEEGSSFDKIPLSSEKAYRKLSNSIKRRRFIKIGSSAAAVLVVAVSVFIAINHQSKESLEANQGIKPGTDKAVLVLNNGKEIDLSENKEILLEEKDTKIESDGKTLEYHSEKKHKRRKKEIIYNTLKVPRGGQFFLVLSDSTRVWLNAESELRYPVTFSGEKREVNLIGEAYFEVTKNKEHPFVVHSESQDIEVLGTSFNVSAYNDNKFVRTTLVEGSVRINSTSQEIYLEPSFQTVIDLQSGSAITQRVKTELYTSWKDGNYYFENENIETILKTISRWYDFEYEFQNQEARNVCFTGSISREQKIENIFKIIEETQQIKMTAYDKKLVIN